MRLKIKKEKTSKDYTSTMRLVRLPSLDYWVNGAFLLAPAELSLEALRLFCLFFLSLLPPGAGLAGALGVEGPGT